MNKVYIYLFFEALFPLFGASLLFLLWGGVRWITAPTGRTFAYGWREARDSMGWLYGAAILAMQGGAKSLSLGGHVSLAAWSFLSAAACFLLLLSAMTNRGEDNTWKPPRSLDCTAVVLTLIIILLGWRVQHEVLRNDASKPGVHVIRGSIP